MVMGVTHLALGIACWSVPVGLELAPGDLLSFGAVALGSLLPDVDHPGSKLGRRLWWLAWPIHLLFGHRGVTHSLLAWVATTAMAVFLIGQASAGAAFAVGFGSHLLGDAITGGVPFWWPKVGRTGHYLFATGGLGDYSLCLASLAVVGATFSW